METKAIGYSLLAVGILVIIITAFNVYQVFTGSAAPIALFDFPAVEASLSPELPSIEVLPAEVINQSSNIIAHLFLMGFLAGAGGKIANIGVYLLRPIVVKVREEDGKKKV